MSGILIYLLIKTLPQYNSEVPNIQPICVFKCTPPETNLYGNIIANEINAYLNIPNKHVRYLFSCNFSARYFPV